MGSKIPLRRWFAKKRTAKGEGFVPPLVSGVLPSPPNVVDNAKFWFVCPVRKVFTMNMPAWNPTPAIMPQRKPKRTWKPAANKVTTAKAQPKAEPKPDNAKTRRNRRNGGSRFVN